MTAPASDLVIGVDVGSQGARAMVVDERGRVYGTGRRSWTVGFHEDGIHEQPAQQWSSAVEQALSAAVHGLDIATRRSIRAVAATSTSGTLVLTDHAGEPLRPAIMWSDTRAATEADELNATAATFVAATGLRFRASFPLPKLLWLHRHEPAVLERSAHVMHAADYILWHLGAGRAVTDPSNALKTGYDITRDRWDPAVDALGLTDRLPEIAPSGTAIGRIDPHLAERLGLGRDTVLAGTMTDANTAVFAAGVTDPGQWLTTLGTGTSIKGVSARQVVDPTGSAYSHRDPRGLWLPSGTSHLGAAAVSARFGAELEPLTAAATTAQPRSMLVYPLVGRGEYFPVWSPDLTGFSVGRGTEAEEFRATLEGIAAAEELGYRRFAELGAPVGSEIVSMGGASRSGLWNVIRASVQNRSVRPVEAPETAIGAAAFAFAALSRPLAEAATCMARLGPAVDPDPALVEAYADLPDELLDRIHRQPQ